MIAIGLQVSTAAWLAGVNGPIATVGGSGRVGAGVRAVVFTGRKTNGKMVEGASGEIGIGAAAMPSGIPVGEFHGGVNATWTAAFNIHDLLHVLGGNRVSASRPVVQP